MNRKCPDNMIKLIKCMTALIDYKYVYSIADKKGGVLMALGLMY